MLARDEAVWGLFQNCVRKDDNRACMALKAIFLKFSRIVAADGWKRYLQFEETVETVANEALSDFFKYYRDAPKEKFVSRGRLYFQAYMMSAVKNLYMTKARQHSKQRERMVSSEGVTGDVYFQPDDGRQDREETETEEAAQIRRCMTQLLENKASETAELKWLILNIWMFLRFDTCFSSERDAILLSLGNIEAQTETEVIAEYLRLAAGNEKFSTWLSPGILDQLSAGSNLSTIRSHLFRARTMIGKCLKPYFPERQSS